MSVMIILRYVWNNIENSSVIIMRIIQIILRIKILSNNVKTKYMNRDENRQSICKSLNLDNNSDQVSVHTERLA